MIIPDKLCLLLERLFGSKPLHGGIVLPTFSSRVEIYTDALAYVQGDLRLYAYVLGHRRIVSVMGTTPLIDDVLLELACRDPSIIPSDFRERLPKCSRVVVEMEKIYHRYHFPNAFMRAAE